MRDHILDKLTDLARNENTRMRLTGVNTWEITTNVDNKGIAIYDRSFNHHYQDLKDSLKEIKQLYSLWSKGSSGT